MKIRSEEDDDVTGLIAIYIQDEVRICLKFDMLYLFYGLNSYPYLISKHQDWIDVDRYYKK